MTFKKSVSIKLRRSLVFIQSAFALLPIPTKTRYDVELRIMIKNRRTTDLFENSLIGNSRADYRQNLKIFEALYQEARSIGIFPLQNPLDGIDSDIHLARVINVRKTI